MVCPKNSAAKKNLKRKLEDELRSDLKITKVSSKGPLVVSSMKVAREIIEARIEVLKSAFSSLANDRYSAICAARVIADFASNEEFVDMIIEYGAVPPLVMHLHPPSIEQACTSVPYAHELEKECAYSLGYLAIKPVTQQFIVDAGALPPLVNLLRTCKSGDPSVVKGLLRRVIEAITNIAHENSKIKSYVRIEGGIPPLVDLLKFPDNKVQKAAACALKTLVFKNFENKQLVIECNALPTLVLMLQFETPAICYEAVSVIGNLVHSSPQFKEPVLAAGALQSIIQLLSSPCPETQREAALLLGQFASGDSDCRVHIVQRGALQPLIKMLDSSDEQVKEMSAFALGRLAQETHNQSGIAYNGGIKPLLKLLDSKNESLQHNAAFALFGLADNEDNIPALIKAGLIQKLQDGKFYALPTRECAAKTLKRIEEKLNGRVLDHLIYSMRISTKSEQIPIALALAHFCAPDDLESIFIYNDGMELLLGMLESGNLIDHHYGTLALKELAIRGKSISLMDSAPLSPSGQKVYMDEDFINNPMMSDITFLVEGKEFYAHRDCLLAISDTFRAMFNGNYRERYAKAVEIPNIKRDVFTLMMRYIYTGSVDVNIEIAQDLLKVADQYLLEGLKRVCEHAISQEISRENIVSMYELAETYNANELKEACILFTLDNFQELSTELWYFHLIKRMIPDVRNSFRRMLTKSAQFADIECPQYF